MNRFRSTEYLNWKECRARWRSPSIKPHTTDREQKKNQKEENKMKHNIPI